MEYYWKQNKSFVIAVGAGLLGAFLWQGWIIGPLGTSAEAIRLEREAAEAALLASVAGGQATEDMLARAAKDLDRTQELARTLAAEMGAPEKPPFRAPEGRPAPEYFGNLHLERWTQLQEAASQVRMDLAQRESPFGRVTNATPEAARELLIRLALVERVCRVAIEAGIQRIESIAPTVGADNPGDASAQPGQYLNRLPVRVKLRGSAEAVFRVVHALQKKGDYYAVTAFSAIKEEEHADLFACELEVSALLVDEKGSVALPEEAR